MIIANWPDHCPDCLCTEFYVSSRVKSRLMLPDQRKERYTNRRVRFTCRDEGCGCEWVVDLVSVDPFVFVSPKFDPIAVVTPTEEEAKDVLVLDEEADRWRVFRLSELVARGGKRAQLVAQMAAVQEDSGDASDEG